MIIRKEDKIEIYEDKIKSKRYLVLLLVTLILLIINSISTENSLIYIEIAAYIIIVLGVIITVNNIIKPAKKVLVVDKQFLTIIYKKEKEKIEINKIKNITTKLNMHIVNFDEEKALPIFKKYVSLSANEITDIINEYKNK